MKTIDSIEELEALYDKPVPQSITKVVHRITPLYRQWIEASRFLVLTSVGPEGCDASPRGDRDSVVRVADENTLLLPDWRGNNRLDSLRNIVRDDRVSLMFMVPGCANVVRVVGRATLSTDDTVLRHFDRDGKRPKIVIVVTTNELYFQCAKAIMRSRLWLSDDESNRVPTAGQFLREIDTQFDVDSYDSGYADNAKERMW